MTENQKKVIKYKDYPEGSGGKNSYDRYFLPFEKYLEKYYYKLSSKGQQRWERWHKTYIEPSFDRSKQEEFAKKWGYTDIKYHYFDAQYHIYNQLKNDNNERLDDGVRKFIGFLAGVGFFKQYDLTLEKWFNIKNWYNPNVEEEEEFTINEILSYPYGINYFKDLLTQMHYWKRL